MVSFADENEEIPRGRKPRRANESSGAGDNSTGNSKSRKPTVESADDSDAGHGPESTAPESTAHKTKASRSQQSIPGAWQSSNSESESDNEHTSPVDSPPASNQTEKPRPRYDWEDDEPPLPPVRDPSPSPERPFSGPDYEYSDTEPLYHPNPVYHSAMVDLQRSIGDISESRQEHTTHLLEGIKMGFGPYLNEDNPHIQEGLLGLLEIEFKHRLEVNSVFDFLGSLPAEHRPKLSFAWHDDCKPHSIASTIRDEYFQPQHIDSREDLPDEDSGGAGTKYRSPYVEDDPDDFSSTRQRNKTPAGGMRVPLPDGWDSNGGQSAEDDDLEPPPNPVTEEWLDKAYTKFWKQYLKENRNVDEVTDVGALQFLEKQKKARADANARFVNSFPANTTNANTSTNTNGLDSQQTHPQTKWHRDDMVYTYMGQKWEVDPGTMTCWRLDEAGYQAHLKRHHHTKETVTTVVMPTSVTGQPIYTEVAPPVQRAFYDPRAWFTSQAPVHTDPFSAFNVPSSNSPNNTPWQANQSVLPQSFNGQPQSPWQFTGQNSQYSFPPNVNYWQGNPPPYSPSNMSWPPNQSAPPPSFGIWNGQQNGPPPAYSPSTAYAPYSNYPSNAQFPSQFVNCNTGYGSANPVYTQGQNYQPQQSSAQSSNGFFSSLRSKLGGLASRLGGGGVGGSSFRPMRY